MRRPRQLVFWCVLVWVIGGTTARVLASDRTLLAHAAGDALWVANVVPRPTFATGGPLVGPALAPPPEPAEQTQVLVRHSLPGRAWRLLAVIPGRVTSMAARESELAVLLADGHWVTVWSDGTASGQPLPAGGQIRALADDGQTLWAVGAVAGGLPAAREDLALEAAATRPVYPVSGVSTQPSTAPAVEPPVKPGTEVRLVLFRQTDGRWAAESELPPALVNVAGDDLSVAVVGHAPTVAYRSADGSICELRWRDGGHGWEEVGRVPVDAAHPVAAFQLLADAATGPLLWTTAVGADPGRVRAAGGDAVAVPLRWPGPPPLTGLPVAAIAGGYLRVIGPSGIRAYEQRYELTGAPVGVPAEVAIPPDLGDTPALLWVQGMLLASLAFTIGTSVYRQVAPAGAVVAGSPDAGTADAGSAATGVAAAPRLAPAAAGAIDLVPLIACGLGAWAVASRHPDESMPAGAVWLVVVGAVLYLAHTTLLETLTARSAGKWITGLRVATTDGRRPEVWQLAARNVLRCLDPLVWIVLSPLRQRTADVLAGTVVVRDARPAAPPSTPASPPEAGA
jgi:uncharacterized RDD family membrane protein YckC